MTSPMWRMPSANRNRSSGGSHVFLSHSHVDHFGALFSVARVRAMNGLATTCHAPAAVEYALFVRDRAEVGHGAAMERSRQRGAARQVAAPLWSST